MFILGRGGGARETRRRKQTPDTQAHPNPHTNTTTTHPHTQHTQQTHLAVALAHEPARPAGDLALQLAGAHHDGVDAQLFQPELGLEGLAAALGPPHAQDERRARRLVERAVCWGDSGGGEEAAACLVSGRVCAASSLNPEPRARARARAP